jgi:hypothetical protein
LAPFEKIVLQDVALILFHYSFSKEKYINIKLISTTADLDDNITSRVSQDIEKAHNKKLKRKN